MDTSIKSNTANTCGPEFSDPSNAPKTDRYPRLNKEEERQLAKAWRNEKDEKARERLIVSNTGFVVYIAKSHSGYGLPMPDLVQEGHVGLIKAVDRFDPTLGYRLSTYAVRWIRSAIQEFVIANSCQVKIATTLPQKKLFFKLRGLRKYHDRSLRKEEISKIAEILSVCERDVVEMEKRLYAKDAALLHRVSSESSLYLINYIPDENAPDPLEEADENFGSLVSWEKVEEALGLLNDRSRDIIKRRILSENPLKLRELAEVYKLSVERIRQLERNALLNLRAQLQKYIR